MKRKSFRGPASALSLGALSVIFVAGPAQAATYTKADNVISLEQGGSWGGTAPAAADIANWSGTYNTAGSLAATLPGSTLTWQGIKTGAVTGTAAGIINVGGSGAAVTGSGLTIGSSGIEMTGANQDLVLNAATLAFHASQTWTVPTGRNLRLGATALSANVDGTGGNATAITLTGGGTVDANQGAANGFTDFTGKWIVQTGTMLRGVGTGTAAWGANTSADAITLNGGTLAIGAISGSISAAAWPNPITLGAATTSKISGQHLGTGTPDLTLQGLISGDGNLLIEKAAGTPLIVRVDRGDNTYTGTTGIVSGASGSIAVFAHVGTAGGATTPFGVGEISVTGASALAAALEFTTTALSTPSNAEAIVANPIKLNNATLRTREGLFAFDGNLNLTGANVIQGQVDLKDITLNGLIDGPGSVTLRSVGTQRIRLTGANTYGGGTILGAGTSNAGIVVLGDAGSLGTGTITARGAQIWSGVPDMVLANNILVGSGTGGGLCFGGTNNISLTGSVTVDNASRPFQNSGTGMITLAGIDLTAGASSMASFNSLGTTKGPFTVSGAITGAGKVEVRGGVVTLAGASNYTGTTTVSSAGRLNLTGSLTSAITMTGAGASISGAGTTTGNLTTTGASGAGTIYLDPANPTAAITAANVAINGPTKVDLLSQQALGTTTYTVLNYTGTFTGLANLASAQTRGTFADDAIGKKITFAATTGTRTWNGAASTVWNTTDLNWNEDDKRFYGGDEVVFGNTGAGALTIAGVVSPSLVNFSNSSGSNYTLTSTAGNQISGPGGLVKTGTGTVTLVGSNTFAGRTVLSDGILAIREDTCLGAAPTAPVPDQLRLNGGTLKLEPAAPANFTLAATRGITLAGGVATLDTTAVGNSATATVAGETDGGGDLVILANGDTSLTGGGVPGSTALTGTSLRTGSTTIKSGVVAIESRFGDTNAVVILDGGGLVDRNINVTFSQPMLAGAAGGILRSYGTATTGFTGSIGNAPGVTDTTLTHTDGGTQNHSGDASGFNGTFINARGYVNFDSDSWQGTNFVNVDGEAARFRSGTVARVRSVSTDRDLHIEAGTTLDVISGNVTVAPGTATQNFWIQNTGTLTSSSGTLTFDFQTPFTTAGAEDQSVRVVIADPNETTPLTVVKNGPGGINMYDQANTYSGGTVVNAGRINVTSALALGIGPATVKSGGQLFLTEANGFYANNLTIEGAGPTEPAGNLGAVRFGNNTVAGNLTIAAAGARMVAYQGAAGTLDGSIDGSGNLELNSPAAGHNGSFKLTGDSSAYAGTLTLAQGSLELTGTLGGIVTLANGTTLAGEGTVNGKLNLGGGGGMTLRVDGLSTEALTANNPVTGGPCQVQLDSLPDPLEPITILKFTTLTGTLADFQNAATSIRRLAFTNTGTAITGEVVMATRTWSGAASGAWDSAALNWVEGDQRFFTGDSVVFNDTAVNRTVTIANPVSPAAVEVNNSTGNDFTITGRMITPADGNLVKAGSGTCTLSGTPSSIGGDLVINGGRVTLATTDYLLSLGATAGIIVNDTGILRLNGTNVLYEGANSSLVTVNAGGTVELNAYHTHFKDLILNGGTLVGMRSDADTRYNNEYTTFDVSVTVGGTQMSTISRISGGAGTFNLAGAPFDVGDVAPGTDLLVTAPLVGGTLTKNGAGTMTLAATCGYGGGTVVNAGTLLANNISGSGTGNGPVTVKAGATLGGTGTAAGAVTVESGGTLAPGETIESLATGKLTLADGSTLAMDIQSAGTPSADSVIVGGDVTLASTLTVTDLASTPAVIAGGTKLTLLSYTGTLTGTFVGLAEEGTLTVGVNTFKIRYNDGKRVTLESMASGDDYATWAAAYAPLGGPTADDDHDGLTNRTEYAFGLNPKNGSSANPITQLPNKVTGMFTYTRRKPSLTGLTYKVWTSTNLTTWTLDAAAVQSPTDIGDNQNVAVTLSGAKPLGAPKLFVRVSAE